MRVSVSPVCRSCEQLGLLPYFHIECNKIRNISTVPFVFDLQDEMETSHQELFSADSRFLGTREDHEGESVIDLTLPNRPIM